MHARSVCKRLGASYVAVVTTVVFGTVGFAHSAALSADPNPNSAVVSRIVDRWVPIASQLRVEASQWKAQFSSLLSLASAHTLSEIDAMTPKSDNDGSMLDKYQRAAKMAAADAGSFFAGRRGSYGAKLGSTTTDLVFTPITPCRVVDTRVASAVSGPLTAGTQRNFYFYSDGTTPASWATQGGDPGVAAAACPGTVLTSGGGTLGSVAPAAVVATITAVNTTAAGNYVVWGGGSLSSIPNTSMLNWNSAGQIIANTTVIPWGGRTGGNLDFTVRYNGPSGAADVVVDVVGYFSENSATALSCQTQTQSATVPIGLTVTPVTVSCTGSFTATGGGCAGTGALTAAVVLASNPTANGWNCTFLQGGVSYTGTAYANCCQVPGK